MIGTTFKWLLIIAILTSTVGVYYYFKVVIAMYFKQQETNHEEIKIGTMHLLLLALTTLVTLVLGVVPNYVINIFS